ncbi:Mechanosensitive ion channel-domain-containing protein, partial [Umbelopsis sp. PMI_123]
MVFVGLVLIAITALLNVLYAGRQNDVSLNLELWFTFLSFIYVMAIVTNYFVEIVPSITKHFVKRMTPTTLEIFKMRLAYYHSLKSYIKVLLVSAWAWGSWSFLLVVPNDERNYSYTWVVGAFLEALFFASGFLFLEKFILQLIDVQFNMSVLFTEINSLYFRKAYYERIEKNDNALKVLDKLKKSIRKRPEFNLKEHNKKHRNGYANRKDKNPRIENQFRQDISSNGSTTCDEKEEVHHKEHTHHKDDSHVLRHQNTVDNQHPRNTLSDDGNYEENGNKQNVHREETDKKYNNRPDLTQHRPTLSSRSSSFDAKSFLDFGTTNLKALFSNKAKAMASILPVSQNSRQEAKWLARQLFNNIVAPDNDVIFREDFVNYFATSDEAQKAFDVFDRDKNGNISKRELRNGTLEIFKERKHLAASLRDLSQASGKLDNILIAAFAIIWVLIVATAFGVNIGSQLLPLWTMFVAISFIFGNSAKDMFESIIFVFVTHPYDVGDRVFVGTENWTVVEIDLLTTTFKKWDGTTLYAHHTVIAPQYICNLRRSGPMAEVIEFNIHFSTPAEKIYRLRESMLAWYNEKPRSFTHNTMCMNIMSLENMNKFTCIFYIEHCASWQDMGFRWSNRNAFMMQLKATLEDLQIGYSLPTQPIYTGNDIPVELRNFGKYQNYGAKGYVAGPPHGFRD